MSASPPPEGPRPGASPAPHANPREADAALLARVRDELGVPAPLLRAAEDQARRAGVPVGAVLVKMGLLSLPQRVALSAQVHPEDHPSHGSHDASNNPQTVALAPLGVVGPRPPLPLRTPGRPASVVGTPPGAAARPALPPVAFTDPVAPTAPGVQPLPAGVATLEDVADRAAASEARARERRRREVLPALPSSFERYVMGDEIARGGMGRIVAATDLNLGREVAMKRLIRGQAEQLGLQLRFVEEGQITGQLQHPNIVPVHDLGTTTEGDLFFTMKRVHGRTLRDVFRGLRRDEPEIVAEFGRARLLSGLKQVCMGLAYSHARGVVHRDIKPSNIMFGDFGEVLIMDWGLAKILARDVDAKISSHREGQSRWATRQGEVIGTPGYMPPELALGQLDDVDGRADVYSLGAILYEILTLRPPYTGRDARTILQRMLREPLVAPSERAPDRDVPPELEAICVRCLHKDPDRRFPSARAVHDAVEAYLEGTLARDRQQALAREDLETGATMAEQHRELRATTERLVAEAAEQAAALPPWAGAERRRALWEAEAQLETLRRAQADTFSWAVQALRQALTRDPALTEARDALGELYWYAFLSADEAADQGNMQHYEALLRTVDAPRYDGLLRGDGRLVITTDPPGVRAALFRIEAIDHIATPVSPRDVGITPTTIEPLPMGSYLLVLRSPGLRDTHVPVRIRRLAREEVSVRLRADTHLARGLVFVPGGRYDVGGDALAAWSLPAQKTDLTDFGLGRLPVSCRQYLDFLNDLAETDAARARLRQPRLFPTGGFLWVHDAGRGFALPARGPDGEPFDPNWPVSGISRNDAEAWCVWRSGRDGVTWRLPTEQEWEVAARGPDGRRFVWGDVWEPTYCNCAHARPGPPGLEPCGSYPTDRSPYGVLDMAGGVADWTSTRVSEGAAAIVRGGAWNQLELYARAASRRALAPDAVSEAVGFRVACTL